MSDGLNGLHLTLLNSDRHFDGYGYDDVTCKQSLKLHKTLLIQSLNSSFITQSRNPCTVGILVQLESIKTSFKIE